MSKINLDIGCGRRSVPQTLSLDLPFSHRKNITSKVMFLCKYSVASIEQNEHIRDLRIKEFEATVTMGSYQRAVKEVEKSDPT